MSALRLETAAPQEHLARALEALQNFEIGYLTRDINAAIVHAKTSASAFPDCDEGRADALSILGVSLQRRYQTATTKDIGDIEQAVRAAGDALKLKIRDSRKEDLQDYFQNLERGIAFYCKETKEATHVEEAIKTLDEIVESTSYDSHARAFALEAVCNLSSFGFEQTGSLDYLERGISAAQAAVCIIPEQHSLRTAVLGKLGDLHNDSFQQTKSVSNLDGIIGISRELLNMKPDNHANRLRLLHNLAVSFSHRYDVTDDLVDIERAIEYGQTAVKLSLEKGSGRLLLPEKHVLIHNLRNHLRIYFERSKEFPQVNEAVLDNLSILNLNTNEDTNSIEWLRRLGDAFQRRYQQDNRVADLEYAILCTVRAMQSVNDSHESWEQLEDSYRARYRLWSEHTGKIPDSEIVIFGFGGKRGGTWVPPELKLGLDLMVPCMILVGDLPSDMTS